VVIIVVGFFFFFSCLQNSNMIFDPFGSILFCSWLAALVAVVIYCSHILNRINSENFKWSLWDLDLSKMLIKKQGKNQRGKSSHDPIQLSLSTSMCSLRANLTIM
jgi:hypothetical protein